MRLLIVTILLLCSTLAQARQPHSIWLYNETDDQIKMGLNMDQIRPIASITKLMTAMVTLDHFKDLKQKIKVKPGSKLPVQDYSLEDLLTAMLVRSDNVAAETLADNYPGGRREFLRAMNTKARTLGMSNTRFLDPSGLSVHNSGTAGDVGVMVSNAAKYDFIRQTSVKKQAIFEAHYKKKIRTVVLENTNKKLLFEFDNIIVSKTGFTNPAGFCLALAVQQNRKRYIVVVLGAKNPSERIDLVEKLMYNHIKDQDIQDYDKVRN